jgi:hypothetical protein
MREMRQSSRLGVTPWVLFALTLVLALLMCSIGGLSASEHTAPASLGQALFQVFFSLAYLVVVVVGPAIAANSIASEREGRTWEAVLLSGLEQKTVARGKFLAAYTTIALYIVFLAPVGALSFLFGGVTATEVVVAFGFLFLFAALAVAFGLAVSSLMTSLRGAIVVTLILAILIGPSLHGLLGVAGSLLVHREWPEVPEAYPVWLPLAYTRASFGLDYALILVVLPLVLVIAPATFLYEVTIASLGSDADDRSTGLKRWYALVTPVVAATFAIPCLVSGNPSDRMAWAIFGLFLLCMHVGFMALLFAAEPPGPSRRVRVHWERRGAGAFTRAMGPGLVRTMVLVLLFGVIAIAGYAAITVRAVMQSSTPHEFSRHVAPVLAAVTYAMPFFAFVVGLVAWVRARGATAWGTRLIVLGVLFLISAGPWVVAAIGGVLSRSDSWLAVAAPSPFYALTMVVGLNDQSSNADFLALVGSACASVWGLIGLVFFAGAARRTAMTVREADLAYAQAMQALEEEAGCGGGGGGAA